MGNMKDAIKKDAEEKAISCSFFRSGAGCECLKTKLKWLGMCHLYTYQIKCSTYIKKED